MSTKRSNIQCSIQLIVTTLFINSKKTSNKALQKRLQRDTKIGSWVNISVFPQMYSTQLTKKTLFYQCNNSKTPYKYFSHKNDFQIKSSISQWELLFP